MNKIVLKEYKDSTIYITTMLIVFAMYYILLRSSLVVSGFYGFTIGSGLYFGFQYGYKKMIEKN